MNKMKYLPYMVLLMLSGCGSGGDEKSDDATPDNVPPPAALIASIEATKIVNEPTSGSQASPVNVSLSGTASEDVSISYSVETEDSIEGNDYTLVDGTVTIAKGTRTVGIPLEIINDDVDENDEHLVITLTGAEGANLHASSTIANIIIKDQDPDAEVQFKHILSRQGSEASNGVVGISLIMDKASDRNVSMSDRRHLLPDAALLRTQRATFTALGSSLHEGVLCYPATHNADSIGANQEFLLPLLSFRSFK